MTRDRGESPMKVKQSLRNLKTRHKDCQVVRIEAVPAP